MNHEEKRINDLEHTVLLAFDLLLNDEVEQAKEILKNQIEKTYDKN